MELKPGSVIRWNNFPFPHQSQPKGKSRWFICLGTTQRNTLIILVTTTTQLQDFEPNGKRKNHIHLRLDPDTTPFTELCLLDLDEPPYPISYEKYEQCLHDIEYKGFLEHSLLQTIYTKIPFSSHYSKILIQDIQKSFSKHGILRTP